MTRVLALVCVVAWAGVVDAHPIGYDHRDRVLLVDADPEVIAQPPPVAPARPPRFTRLGLRVGAGTLPIAGHDLTALGLLQLGADLELRARTRLFGEYEWLILSETPSRPEDAALSATGHRASVGVSRELVDKAVKEVRFYGAVEAGAGAALLGGTVGSRALGHGFVGLRLGFEVDPDDPPATRNTLGFELVARALVVPDGVGMMFGLGLLWGS